MNVSSPSISHYRYVFLLLAAVFSVASLFRRPEKGISFSITVLLISILFLLNKFWPNIKELLRPTIVFLQRLIKNKLLFFSVASWIPFILLGALVSYTLYGIRGSPVRLRALGGYFFLLFIAFCASSNPRGIRFRPVIGGLALQLLAGTLFLKWEPGVRGLHWLVGKAVSFMDLTFHGSQFVYGIAAKSPNICGFRPPLFFTWFPAFQIVVFFGAVVSFLYYCNIIQVVLQKISIIVRGTLGTSAVESLNAVACIFVGQTEAALLISNSLTSCSRSELHSIMTAGYSCIAGSLFSAYISLGACPNYLLVATIMSACVSLSVSKIVYPEETTSDPNEEVQFPECEASSALESISAGAVKSAQLVIVIGSILVVTFGLLSAVNAILGYLGSLVGHDFITLNWLMTQLFYPLAYLMGASDASDPQIASQETAYVGELMGIKTAVNEFVAYSHLSDLISSGRLIGARARMIATFACCGFSNISMLGNMLAIMTSLAPSKKEEILEVIVKSLFCGCISCFLTATVAGIIVDNPVVCSPLSSFSSCVDISQASSLLKNHTIFL